MESIERRASREHPSPILSDPAWSGELLVAQVRVLITALLFSIRAASWDLELQVVGVVLNAAALVSALIWWATVRKRFRGFMGYASSASDVTLVSLLFAGLIWNGRADAAINSRVAYDLYLLAIGMSALRFNWRISALTTALALVQFQALQLWVEFRGEIGFSSLNYGRYDASIQFGRSLILVIAGILSVALVRRAQELLRLSSTDWLTGLANRGVFDARLRDQVLRGGQTGAPFVVALMDLDSFKALNDRHGHPAGDRALRSIASALSPSVRDEDTLARVGGEEFGLILPGASLPQALSRLEGLREAVAAVPEIAQGTERMSISIGASAFPADGESVAELMDAADQRLYQAKALGRNRVVGASLALPTSAA